MELDRRSLNKLEFAHPLLKELFLKAAENTPRSFIITETLRTQERQRELVLAGKSTKMNSRHLAHPSDGLSRAVDIAIWEDKDEDKVVDVDELSWKLPLYEEIANHVKEVALELGIVIRWGGDWTSFKDGPHFELSTKVYG